MPDTDEKTHPVHTIASLLLLDVRRIQQLAKEGHIPRAARGRYPLVGSVQGYIRYLRSRIDADGVVDINEERRRWTRAKADLAELERKEREGMLVPADQIETFMNAIVSRVRQGVLSLPSRTAPQVQDAETIPQIEAIVREQCHEVLRELAGTKVRWRESRGSPSIRLDRGSSAPKPAPAA